MHDGILLLLSGILTTKMEIHHFYHRVYKQTCHHLSRYPNPKKLHESHYVHILVPNHLDIYFLRESLNLFPSFKQTKSSMKQEQP